MFPRPMDEVSLRAELATCQATIDAAYWNFTRQARAKPPVLVCQKAYTRRQQILALLRDLQTRERLTCQPVSDG